MVFVKITKHKGTQIHKHKYKVEKFVKGKKGWSLIEMDGGDVQGLPAKFICFDDAAGETPQGKGIAALFSYALFWLQLSRQ